MMMMNADLKMALARSPSRRRLDFANKYRAAARRDGRPAVV